MLSCPELFRMFKENNFIFFTGVPDSTFKQWMDFLDDHNGEGLTNRIVAIERDSVAWASGYHMATGNVGVVYLQNSGLGNIVNPVTSLTDEEVYHVPMLLMVGWRGEPSKKDAPQHIKMGRITLDLLDTLGIEYGFLSEDHQEAEKIIKNAKEYIDRTNKAYALVIKKGIFGNYNKLKIKEQDTQLLKREECIDLIVDTVGKGNVIVGTTGKTSRELFECREKKKQSHENDFLMVGSMGCASSFAAEIALQRPKKKVFILDGDGAAIMSAGALSTIGYYQPRNFYHILFDNESHESTGGQPTTSSAVNFVKLALANNYQGAQLVSRKGDLINAISMMKSSDGPQMLIVRVKKGSRPDLGRPTISPIKNKELFMKYLDSK